MKLLFTVLLPALLLAGAAFGKDNEVSAIDYCQEFSMLGRSAMTARQADKPLADTLKSAVRGVSKLTDKYSLEWSKDEQEDFAAYLVMNAYQESIVPLDEYKKQAITDYENRIFRECYNELNDDSENASE